MKLITALASVTLLVLGMAYGAEGESPEDAVTSFLAAIKAGDGANAAAYMSSHALSEMDDILITFKENPEMIVTSLGVEVTVEELNEWTTSDLYAAMFETEESIATQDGMQYEVISSEIDGEEASVIVTSTDGDSEVDMILENGNWLIYEFL